MPSDSKSSASSRDKAKEAETLKAKRKEYMKKADPSTVEELVSGEETGEKWFEEGQWGLAWAEVEFDADACLKNIRKNNAEGFNVPAGSILPLGAQMPEMTILKYGGYFPEGTSFPGGVSVPMHARMVNLLPEETKAKADAAKAESICVVQ